MLDYQAKSEVNGQEKDLLNKYTVVYPMVCSDERDIELHLLTRRDAMLYC